MTVHLRTDEAETALNIIEAACLTGEWKTRVSTQHGNTTARAHAVSLIIELPFASTDEIEFMARTTRRMTAK